MIRELATLSGLLVSAAVALSGGADPPKPFAHEGPTDNILLRLSDSPGIMVEPPIVAPPLTGDRFAVALVVALRRANIPASVGTSNGTSYQLVGRSVTRPMRGGRDDILLYWELADGRGNLLGDFVQRDVGAPGAWAAADETLLAGMANDAAARIADLIQDKPVQEAKPPRFHLAGVSGAPGDGNTALRRALEYSLIEAAFPITKEREGANVLTVSGEVAVVPAGDGEESVTIIWRVRDSRGREIGTVDQDNRVAAGSLNGNWGDIAYAVADAATPGLGDVLRQMGGGPTATVAQ